MNTNDTNRKYVNVMRMRITSFARAAFAVPRRSLWRRRVAPIRVFEARCRKNTRHEAFTMIELLVVVAIFALVSAALLANYPQFSSRIILENTAHEIALSMRQAQTFGLSVRGFGAGAEAAFPGYGLYFFEPASDSRKFVLFGDVDGDKLHNKLLCGASESECLEQFQIQNNNRIYALCTDLKSSGVPAFSTTEDVQNAGDSCGVITELHISYTRPEPDATITGRLPDDSYETYADAEIVVASPRNDVKTIVVWTTGQIAVE